MCTYLPTYLLTYYAVGAVKNIGQPPVEFDHFVQDKVAFMLQNVQGMFDEHELARPRGLNPVVQLLPKSAPWRSTENYKKENHVGFYHGAE